MNMKRKLTVLLLGTLFLLPQAPAQELSYRRVTMKERVEKFYRTGGKSYLGKKVHLLIPAKVFKKKPLVVRRPGYRIYHLFPNRSVPILANPKNIYLKRLLRKLKSKKERISTVSVFGRIIRPSWDMKGRCHLMIDKMKTYGGGLKRIGG